MRVRTTYLGPTDHEGARIRVSGNGNTRTLPYDYAARNPHTSAIRRLFGPNVTIAYVGDHARGHWYEVT